MPSKKARSVARIPGQASSNSVAVHCVPLDGSASPDQLLELALFLLSGNDPGYDPQAAPAALAHAQELMTVTPERVSKTYRGLVRAAAGGDPLADFLVCSLAEQFIVNDVPLPQPLKEYVSKVLKGDRPKLRPGRVANWQHEQRIVAAINLLRQARRGCSVRSACSIISTALEQQKRFITPDAVMQIWKRHKNPRRPKGSSLSSVLS